MPARWMQAKILKQKRLRRSYLKAYKMDGIIRRHTGPWPATARTIPREEAFSRLYNHVKIPDPWLVKLFGLDKVDVTSEGRFKATQQMYELANKIEAFQRITIIDGKYLKLFLLYCTYSVANQDRGSLKVSEYRYLESDLIKKFVRVSYGFNSREKAVTALKNDRVIWKETHSLLP